MTNLILDTHFSSGLLWAAYRDNWVEKTEVYKQEVANIGESGIKKVIQPRTSSRYTRKALELALIYDSVSLSGLPGDVLFSWDKLNSEGLVGGSLGRGQVPIDVQFSPEYLSSKLEPLSQYLRTQYIRAVKGFTNDSDMTLAQSRLITSAGLHILNLNDVCNGKELLHFYHHFDQLFNSAKREEEGLNLYCGVAETTVMLSHKLSLDLLTTILSLLELYSLILNIVTLDSLSSFSGIPVASSIYREYGKEMRQTQPQTDLSHEAFQLCCLSMKGIVNYAPVVESIDDVLRLRDDKRIQSFRVALSQWSIALKEGEEKGLKEIAEEISRRSDDLKRLEKWKKVDRWVYHATLPLFLIPVISNIHTVFSYGVRMKIEHTQNSNWLLLGR